MYRIVCFVCWSIPLVYTVGHAHPRVAEAVAKQMTTLTCSTLYLHENILKYAEHLRTKLPGDLSSFHFTNSGYVENIHYSFYSRNFAMVAIESAKTSDVS